MAHHRPNQALKVRGFPAGSGPETAARNGRKCFLSLGWWSACVCGMYKYISVMVSVFSVRASWLGHRQSFSLHSIPLGLLPGFLIRPLFPLNSPGYFPRNSSAPFRVFCFFFCFVSGMRRLHIPRAHVENVSICNISISPAREDAADDNLNSAKQRKPSRDCRLNLPPQRNQATPGLAHHSRN